ncbi:DNA alkylation repair protein [Microbacterium sp. LRZ72]|uniref:DNA alkylation repair protein n=1 Tax=Microbacterium sp. LRZ72 TaxID=2942481 RepID=UPI0029B7CEB6|nr:DNA alkylation repair protein [Microbacterium sp. LRZ72]MDX2378047.1 DNA alkylation repair protein [Microbacterium sp. LRZ72]
MPFADELLGTDAAHTLTEVIRAAHAETDAAALSVASESLAPLPLRERADLLRDALLADVPGDYATLARVVRTAARSPEFTGWLIWPVTGAIAARAVADGSTAAFDDGMALLAELTGRLTAEFAIRTMLRADLGRALDHARTWTSSDDPAVRRLASESTRLYLPWAVRVPALARDTRCTIPILDALYRDSDEVVRRSVANHLNDISRDNPALVVETAERWLAQPADTTASVVRHALRTLVKRGDADALALLGFTAAALEVAGPVLDADSVPFGGTVRFTGSIRNAGAAVARVAIDYVVFHRKANGTQTTKTFKLAARELAPWEVFTIDRAHSFRPITTRRYHPGAHAIALQVNGARTEAAVFELLPDEHTAR